MRIEIPALVLLAAAGLAGCADTSTSVASTTPNPTPARKTRDALDPARGPAEAAVRAKDRAANPDRP